MPANKTKIAFVVPTFRPGGAERMLLTVANDLADDYDVHIIFLKEEGDFLSQLSPSVTRWNIDNGSIYFSYFSVRKLLKKIKPDIFFPWMGYLNAYYIFFRPFLPRKMKWLCRESSIPSLMNPYYRFSFLYRFFYRFYNRYDAIVCQSQYMARDLQQHFGVKLEKIEIINNPVDTERADILREKPLPEGIFKTGKYRLLYVGGLHPWKRVHLIVESMALLPAEYELSIVGDGTEKPAIEKLIAEKGLSARIKIVSGETNPYPYYSAASCLILCSKFEGFPNVISEALISGCPAVGYNIKGGANEVLVGYGGFIAEGENIEVLVETLRQICENTVLDKSRIAKESRDKYDKKIIMARYRSLLG